jgi:hypothetical protein
VNERSSATNPVGGTVRLAFEFGEALLVAPPQVGPPAIEREPQSRLPRSGSHLYE